jgi:hypothetical protein
VPYASAVKFTVDIDPASWANVALGTIAAILGAAALWVQPSLSRRFKALVSSVVVIGIVVAVLPFLHRSAASESASGIHFLVPPNTVPRCNVYQGTGDIPDGHELLILDRPVDSNGNSQSSTYYLDGEASRTSTGWQTPQFDVGSEHVEIAAVLVDSDLASYLGSLIIVNASGQKIDGSWVSQLAPPGSHVKPSIFINPNLSGTKPC